MKYRIIRRLGSGGFGNVYEVQASDGKIYAMKLLRDFSTVNKQRFETEIKILAQLNHLNIVKIFEWNLGGDPPDYSPWYTMEYLPGGSLRTHMDDKFKGAYVFHRNWALNTIILPACHALAQAHSAGIYHRDLKPDNIMYTSNDRVQIKITDWGLGRDIGRKSIALTASIGQVGGTPIYCAPEQWFALDTIDGRADIYSLGVIFYEMMTGRTPPTYDQKHNSLKRPRRVDVPSKYHPTITRELDACMLKMLELDPEKRYQSVWQLISEIESLPDARYFY
ncbi:MAG TPA: serine/threonine-protein kinase [Nitrososphaera sp.]|nr:serine/threonine-protein kinase [Nitrososphaera sp.]